MADPQAYCFHIRPHNDRAAQPQVVSCSSDRVKQIEQRSVILKQRIKDHENGKGIPLETDNTADISFHDLRYLVEDLPLSPGTNPGPVSLGELSKHCSAFWKYQWRPESASILWEHLDNSEPETQNQRGTNSRRCWQQQTSTRLQERSLHLINIAIVFGLDEDLRERMDTEFRQQIQIAVWSSNLDTRLKTSVEYLHDLEAIRRKELEIVFRYFFDKLVNLEEDHPKNVRHIRNTSKTKMGVDFYKNSSKNMENGGRLATYSVYEFVGKLEDLIIGRAHESGPHRPKIVDAPHKLKDAPDVDWSAAAKAAVRETASVSKRVFSYLSGSHDPKWRSEIQNMFEGAQKLIEERQKIRADEIIVSRNDKLEAWKKALQDEQEIV